jgi:uncharacterized protein (DUF2236 family)
MDTGAMARIAGEGILIAGGARAILLQVAHPSVGRGVAEHSNFSERVMDRLRATLSYVYCMTFGTSVEKRRIAEQVNALHRKVNGPGYDARDPGLQLWVAATLYDTALLLYERWVAPLDERAAEMIYRQYRVLGTALQMPDELWPADRHEFYAYWNDMLDNHLEVTDPAREIYRDLLYPRRIPLSLRTAMPLNRFVTAALLPARIRDAYGIEWNPWRERQFCRFSHLVRTVYPRVPAVIRQLPKTWYLWDMRRRLMHGA